MNKFQLISQVQAKSTLRTSFYDKLKAYDQTIKQHGIPRSSKLAMEAYEVLIQKGVSQTCSFNDESDKIDVDDPQAAFSFAKDKKKTRRIQQDQVKPRKLFPNNVVQFKSDKIHTKTQKSKYSQISAVSEFQIQQTTTKVKPISEAKDEKNSQMQMKQSVLQNYRLKKYGELFLRKIKKQKYQLKDILNYKTATYFNQMKLLKRTWLSIKLILSFKKRNDQIVSQIINDKNEDFLQQCFNQWKKRAFMGETERQHQRQIEAKTVILSQILFLVRLKHNKNVWRKQQRSLQKSIKQFQKLTCILKLKAQRQQKIKLGESQKQLKMLVCKSQLLVLTKLVYAGKILQQTRQKSQVRKCLLIRGLTFFRKIKEYQQFQQVYWRDKSKIIPMYLLLDAVKFSLLRKGFTSPWIKDFDQNIQHSKAYPFLSKYLQKRTLYAWKQMLAKQRQESQRIKYRRGKQFLFKLTLNLKQSVQMQTIKKKAQLVQEVIETPKKIQALQAIMLKSNLHKKIESLQFYLKQRGVSEAIEIMRSYKLTKRYYTRKFIMYAEHSKQKMLETYFRAFKEQVNRRRVHRSLLDTHLRIQGTKKTLKCFRALKNYCFNEKIIKLKSRNLMKIIRRRSFYYFIQQLSSYSKQAIQIDCLQDKFFQTRILIINNRISQWYSAFAQDKMYKNIEQQTQKQYQFQLKWKIFKAIKSTSMQSRLVNQKVSKIKKRSQLRAKQSVMSIFIQKLTKKLMLKNVLRIRQKIDIKKGFDSIKYIADLLKETHQQSFQ